MSKKLIPLLLLSASIFITWFYFWGSSQAFDVPNSSINTFQKTDYISSDTLTIVTYNVGYFSGMTNNLPVKRQKNLFDTNMNEFYSLMNSIKPDILALQEVDFNSDRSHSVNQYLEMGKSEYFNYGASVINWNMTYVPFPYTSFSTHFGTVLSGQAILSKYPILTNERMVLTKPVDASFIYNKFYLDRIAQFSTIDVGVELTVINVHLEAFDDDTREVQAHELIKKIKTDFAGKPYILIGDFNTVPLYTPDKKYVSDPDNNFVTEKTLKLLLDSLPIKATYSDGLALQNLDATYTFPSDKPIMKIDHIYYTPEFIEEISQITIQKNASLSDHLPLILKFRMKK